MTLQLSPRTPHAQAVDHHEVEADGLGRYDIDISLPPGHSVGRSCSVIYVLDGNLFFDLVRSIVHGHYGTMAFPNSIVVGVGYPADEGMASFYGRRNHDFHGPWAMIDELGQLLHSIFDGLKTHEGKPELTMVAGGADRFMAFLRDGLHPAIADRYGIGNEGRHTLIGDSSGGHFVLRALFDPDSHFSRYVCISPGYGSAAGSLEEREAAYAAARDDLDADVFLCAGGYEMEHPLFALCRIVTGVTWAREQLAMRAYRSVRVAAEIMDDEDHSSIAPPAISRGLRFVHDVPLGLGTEDPVESLAGGEG